ncbi:hypothetical protein HC891_01460 [Candidatus Gracilibacteria bacterium]|nr:hypothetical protein [Candidatus Gracilibacteria bacterium]
MSTELRRTLANRDALVDPTNQYWRVNTLEIYRHQDIELRHVHTLLAEDTLTLPLLAGFSCPIKRFFEL